jgi:hypothetical protein
MVGVAPSVRRWLALSAFVVSIVSLGGALLLTASDGGAVLWTLSWAVLAVGCSSEGAVLCLRVPGNVIGWLILGLGLLTGLHVLFDALAAPTVGLADGSVAAVAANLLGPAPLALLPALLLLFPGGRLPSARWRPVAWVWAAAAFTFLLGVVGSPGAIGLRSDPSLTNPIGIGGAAGTAVGVGGFVAVIMLFVAMITAAVSLVVRFRNARGDLRQQLKWFGTAAAGIALVGAASPFLWSLSPPWSTVVPETLWPVAGTWLVVATGIAILRYRLYEIDVIIRRTLIYATLVGSLAVVYLGGIYLIDRALQAVTGQSGAFAVTLSTLAVAAMFQPLRKRIQRGVDHRFYRAKYNATHTLDAFTSRLRDQIDLTALNAEVLDVVNATLQPRHASLWIRPGGPLSGGGSGSRRLPLVGASAGASTLVADAEAGGRVGPP